MAAAPTQTQEGTMLLTKPSEWNVFMVDVAVTIIVKGWSLPIRYASEDSGKLELLNRLNFLEAHGDYAWPKFEAMGYHFDQTMRLRRALVTDVLMALTKIGSVKIGLMEVGTPDSMVAMEQNGGKRLGPVMGEASSEMDNPSSSIVGPSSSSPCPSWFDNKEFLAAAMKVLIERSQTKVRHLHGVKEAELLADVVLENFSKQWGEHPVPGLDREASHVSATTITDQDDGDDDDDRLFDEFGGSRATSKTT
ncbi:hypothetical protein P154DRAFT_570684 [Amniculicola lignicola CBS 123094]|uniref:Uncharacterized protein n=1 Tax=Amniculicola lignicola CBS 123094 TaxID=1392246 RepID=A0A6A5WWH5_9PLEO|nr:hypothetical protein P154DRAFT_570684 [Amniculicola lignicola CBS 123094]